MNNAKKFEQEILSWASTEINLQYYVDESLEFLDTYVETQLGRAIFTLNIALGYNDAQGINLTSGTVKREEEGYTEEGDITLYDRGYMFLSLNEDKFYRISIGYVNQSLNWDDSIITEVKQNIIQKFFYQEV